MPELLNLLNSDVLNGVLKEKAVFTVSLKYKNSVFMLFYCKKQVFYEKYFGNMYVFKLFLMGFQLMPQSGI